MYQFVKQHDKSTILQGWRVTYYGAGILALIVGVVTWFTLKEPERKSIGEEETKDGVDVKKITIWTVICDPRVIMLVLAASIRHCGECHLMTSQYPCVSIMSVCVF